MLANRHPSSSPSPKSPSRRGSTFVRSMSCMGSLPPARFRRMCSKRPAPRRSTSSQKNSHQRSLRRSRDAGPWSFRAIISCCDLAKEAWNRREAIQAEAAAKEFLAKFPDHPEAQQMRALLTNLEQARTVSVDRHKIGVILPLVEPSASRMGQRGRSKRTARYPGGICAGGI